MDSAGFDAAGANFHALDLAAYVDANLLQVRQPTTLVMRVEVRPQKRVVVACCWRFSTSFTLL